MPRRSECLTETDEPCRESFSLLPIHLETEVEANRADGRIPPHAAAGRTPELGEIDLRCACEHVARIEKPDCLAAFDDGGTELGVEDHQAVSADRKALAVQGIDRLERHVPDAESVEREPPDRGIASGKETLARRQLPQRREAGRHAQTRVPGQDQALRTRQRPERLNREERLDESDLRTN